MNQKLYIVYDSKSETYTAPTAHPAQGQAKRSFADAVNSGQGVIAQHPADFTLFEIGDFDVRTGEVKLHETKISLGTGADWVKMEA